MVDLQTHVEHTLHNIETVISKLKMERRHNVVYQIRNENAEEKEKLKALINQGNIKEYHTVVEIDYSKEIKNGKGRKKKPVTVGIEEYIFDGNSPKIRIFNSPIYVYGKYVKLSREMCQTPLLINGVHKTQRNVSDFIESFRIFYGAASTKFMGCGREDIDVRCLQGRPFIIEVVNPTRNLESSRIPVQLYDDVDILECSVVRKECKDLINSSDPSKFYNLLIFSDQKINFEKIYHLDQKTPLRVLHRRANMVRTKDIEVLSVESYEKDGYYYEVDIKASSGSYIKEWVGGDFGRTVPSLDADLLELDVVRVELEIPKDLIIQELDVERVGRIVEVI